MKPTTSIAYVIDPRFPGGTSAAVASELRVAVQTARVTVHAVTSKMFGNKSVAPQIRSVLQELGLQMIWDAPTISADVVLLHNPSFLKFQPTFATRILTRHLIVVAHENFYRPGQKEAFDVGHCLDLIDNSSMALRKTIAPVSPYNRQMIDLWLNDNASYSRWAVLDRDWFNICDFAYHEPTDTPQDRRGRHSRPGIEKFPDRAGMDACFPVHAQSNVILGADLMIAEDRNRPHLDLYPFRALDVAQYFEMIDFMVYFTAPTWRESFGRVIAEAIAAGKVVISDPGTASIFKGGVVSGAPTDVDAIIANFIARPALYTKQVRSAQKSLRLYGPEEFRRFYTDVTEQEIGIPA